MANRVNDLTGQRFGMLTVLRREGSYASGGGATWRCKCDCGKECMGIGSVLRKGDKKSCGCSTSLMQRKTKSKFPFSDGITKTCTRCEQTKAVADFWNDRKSADGWSCWCKTCGNTARQASVAKRRAMGKVGYATVETRKLRLEVLSHYSHGTMQCNCCGDAHVEFLALDHIHGGGNQHRKRAGNNMAVYREVRREGFPSGYRVLCHNCNCSLGHYGYCPHQKEKI